jgi:hypothetical protein
VAQAGAGADVSLHIICTVLELTTTFGRALERPGVLTQQDPPGQPAASGSMTQVERAAAATTLMMVQCMAKLPDKEALELLCTLSHAAPICLR